MTVSEAEARLGGRFAKYRLLVLTDYAGRAVLGLSSLLILGGLGTLFDKAMKGLALLCIGALLWGLGMLMRRGRSRFLERGMAEALRSDR